MSLHYNGDNSYLFVNRNELCRFKANNGNVNFLSQFCLGSISNKFSNTEAEELSLKENVYDFSVDYKSIAVNDILDIHKYLMKKKMISYKKVWICKANICFNNDVSWLYFIKGKFIEMCFNQ